MKEIQISGHNKNSSIKGYALVDDEDFEWLNQWKWSYNNGYAGRTKYLGGGAKNPKRKSIRMHTLLISNPNPKKLETDHINGNRLDNRKENLRLATRQQNEVNKNSYKGVSEFKGVSPKINKKTGSKFWQASIMHNYKKIFLGHFKKQHQAALVYDLWAKDLYGEFAKTNFEVVGFSKL